MRVEWGNNIKKYSEIIGISEMTSTIYAYSKSNDSFQIHSLLTTKVQSEVKYSLTV